MSMVIGEGVADSVSSGRLTAGQKATAFTKSLPKPKTTHPYIVGLSLIVVGGFMLIGSITGTLPSMLAALFDPTALVDEKGNAPGFLSKLVSGVTGDALAGPVWAPVLGGL
jgi:hypothetical protein